MLTLKCLSIGIDFLLCICVCVWSGFRFAYIEFADKESVRTAMALDESLFRGRQIKVSVESSVFLV